MCPFMLSRVNPQHKILKINIVECEKLKIAKEEMIEIHLVVMIINYNKIYTS